MCRNLFKFFNSLGILFRLVPFALFFSFLPYFRIPTRVIDGEDLNELLIFISGEMHHEREFLDDHTAHLSVAHGHRPTGLSSKNGSGLLLAFGNMNLNPAIAYCTN